MTQKRQDFSTPALVSATFNFTALNDDGTVRDLTPFTNFTWQLCLGGPGGEIVATKTLGAGVAVVDAAAGKWSVTVNPADVELSGIYFHVLNGQIGGGQPMRIAEGRGLVSGSPVAAS